MLTLQELGFRDAWALQGGLAAWRTAGLPTEPAPPPEPAHTPAAGMTPGDGGSLAAPTGPGAGPR